MKRAEFDELRFDMECKHCHALALGRSEDQVRCLACGAWQFQLSEAPLSAAGEVDAMIRSLAKCFELPG